MSVGVVTATSFFGDQLEQQLLGNLNNQAASYYLDYDNFTNTPTNPGITFNVYNGI